MSRGASVSLLLQMHPSATVQTVDAEEVINHDTSSTNHPENSEEPHSEAVPQNLSRSSSSIREIYKNSWLKQIPCTDKWSGRIYKSQKPEKFWVVFCVHDEKDAFLEFYENRRSAYSHSPISSVALSECLHISPTIVVQDDDHEFVITLVSQVIRLAASTREQMVEWMDTLRNKLRELNILEPKDNLYSKEPVVASRTSPHPTESPAPLDSPSHDGSASSHSSISLSRLSLRDPNSPLPPVPPVNSGTRESNPLHAAVVYTRNPLMQSTSSLASSVPSSANTASGSNESSDNLAITEQTVSRYSSNGSLHEPVTNVRDGNSSVRGSFSVPNTPVTTSEACLYEPLFCMTSFEQSRGAVRNPSYENPPEPQRHSELAPALPPKLNSELRRLSSSSRLLRGQGSISGMFSTSQGSLNRSLEGLQHSGIPVSTRILAEDESSSTSISNPSRNIDPQEPSSPTETSNVQATHSRSSQTSDVSLPTDESGRVLSLREAQVLKLQSEIQHKSGVRLVLRKKDSINAVAFVDCFGSVWVAGWKQKEHPLLHNTFHIGDRVLSIAGHRVHNVQEALKIIKLQHVIVDFVVGRTPYGKILAIKREYEGQDLGLVREGGTAEIKEVKSGGLVARSGLPPKAQTMDGTGMCNWFLTEINHRPLNLFFKDSEVHDRLNAVGLDISILVQPSELVKALKKQLKSIRNYKDYAVQ